MPEFPATRRSISTGREALVRLIAGLSEKHTDWNEADTRFQFIDPFLTECLGWDKPEVTTERSQDGQRTDYEIGRPRAMIWEAKREGKYFELPANPSRKLVNKLDSVISLSAEVAAAIGQVQGYCANRGVQIAVVCNGHQLIAFLASRFDGVAPLEGQCLVIDGYEQLLKEFPRLWQNLSPAGVAERRLVRLLTTGIVEGIPPKLSTFLLVYPAFRYKSELQENLRTISELLLEDVTTHQEIEPRFFRECYCESGALFHDALLSKAILTARYAALFEPTAQAPTLTSIKDGKSSELAVSPAVVAESLAHRPIVVIGDVGVGKTSFLKHLIYVAAEEEFRESIYLRLDLGSQGALDTDLHAFVLTEIERQLLELYKIDVNQNAFVRGVYDLDVQRFREGIYGELYVSEKPQYEERLRQFLDGRLSQKAEHLRRAIRHLAKGRRQQVIIIIDNADQRALAVQQEAFVIAQNFAQQWDAAVFIAVRPQTFHQSKRAGTLSAYPQKIFSIAPPRPDLMLEKRLVFALNMAEGRLPVDVLAGVQLNLSNIALFIKALLYSLRNNRELVELLSNITGGNMRDVMDLVTKFIGSPNVDANKIIDIMQRQGTYVVPVHEFSKHALLGEYSHYDPASSIALNLFDVRFPDSREHFLIPMIVAFLNHDGPHRNREGFVSSEQIVKEMQNWSFTSPQIEAALRRTTNKRLIETTERVTFEEDITGLVGDMPAAFRATSIGVYHLLRWAPMFAYLDAMAFDTPIFGPATSNKLQRAPNSLSLPDRYDRACDFRDYLNTTWTHAELSPAYFDWKLLVATGNHSFETVAKVAAGIRGPIRK